MKLLLSALILVSGLAWAQSVPVGSPNEGSLKKAKRLPLEGHGYMQIFKDQKRSWGTDGMISMIQKAAKDVKTYCPICYDRLQVEDISARYGGDIDPHSSHENGLDVDLQYYKLNEVEHDPISTGRPYADPMVVDGKVSPNFDAKRNWELMKALHRHGRVQKIFTDKILKNELCSYARRIGEFKTHIPVLRSLRHEKNHQDHIHVRLRCPKNAPDCIDLANPPTGSGCPKP